MLKTAPQTSPLQSPYHFTQELKKLLLLGGPILATQLAHTGMSFVDTLMAGRYSEVDLAAVAIGSSVWFPTFLAMVGVLMATTPIVAQAFGARNYPRINRTAQNGLWLALLLGTLGLLFLRSSGFIFERMEVEQPVLSITLGYVEGLAWGLPAIALFQVLRSCHEGLHQTKTIMYVSFLALAANIPLNYVLIYGKFGFPELGGIGCGYATAMVMWIQLIAIVLITQRNRLCQEVRLFSDWRAPDRETLREILTLGIPMGTMLFIETSMFCLIALLIAKLGPTVVAGHQITFSVTSMVFMFPLSIAMALTIRVGYAIGMGKPELARFIVKVGLTVTGLFSLFTCSLILLFSEVIAGIYTPNLSVQAMAAQLLGLAALFQFSDALQVSSAGALRGYRDSRFPLLVVFVAYWLIAMPLGYTLGLTDLLRPAMGARGFWMALILGLSISAILLAWRLKVVSRRHLRQP